MILVSGIMVLPSCRFLEENGIFHSRSLKQALLWAKQDSARVADSLKSLVIVKNPGKIVQHDTLKNLRSKTLSTESPKHSYHIIIGSFSNSENAKLCQIEYINKGYKTGIIETPGQNGTKIMLVSVISFENNNDAKEYLVSFKRNIDSTAWIYFHK